MRANLENRSLQLRDPSKELAISDEMTHRSQPSTKLNTIRGNARAAEDRKILNSWKEIASYAGRGVRTVQRYEQQLNFPVRRPAGRDRSAVIAFSDEIDRWLNRTPMKVNRNVRTVIVVLDPPDRAKPSNRQAALQASHFNVLSVFSAEEIFATAEKFDVDGFVVDCVEGDETAAEICESLKERHPRKPIFAVSAAINGHAPKCADYVVSSVGTEQLVTAVVEVFGIPKAG